MLKRQMKKNWDENKRAYIVAGTVVGVGILIGMKMQRKTDLRAFKQHLAGAMVLREAANPMFPVTMPISEIKEVLKHIDGAEFFDALVINLNGKQSLIVR